MAEVEQLFNYSAVGIALPQPVIDPEAHIYPDADQTLQKLHRPKKPAQLIRILAGQYNRDVSYEHVEASLCECVVSESDKYRMTYYMGKARAMLEEYDHELYWVYEFDRMRIAPRYAIGSPLVPTHSMSLLDHIIQSPQLRDHAARFVGPLSATITVNKGYPMIKPKLNPPEYVVFHRLIMNYPKPVNPETILQLNEFNYYHTYTFRNKIRDTSGETLEVVSDTNGLLHMVLN